MPNPEFLQEKIEQLRPSEMVVVSCDFLRQQEGQSIREFLDAVAESRGLSRIGIGWNKAMTVEAENVATAFLTRDLAYNVEIMPETSARELAKEFMAQFTPLAEWFTNVGLETTNQYMIFNGWTSLTEHTFDAAIACVDAGAVGILLVADED